MQNITVIAGSADVSVVIRIIDSADGTPETGVVFNTAGIALEYRREGAASTAITEATQTINGAHSDGGIVHIGNGYYRLDLPDAAAAAGVAGCLVHGTVTGMIVVGCYIQLVTAGTDLIYSRIGAPAGASVSADIAAVKSDSAAILTDTADIQPKIGTPAGASVSADIAAVKVDTAATLADTGTDGVVVAAASKAGYALSTSGNEAVADQVWDEATSGHVASGSFGQSLATIRAATAQAGAATTITLDASASATDDFYNNALIKLTAGTGAGQARFITDYNGTTKVATVGTWAVNPDATSVFVIISFDAIPGATAPTAAEVADAVWDEARADHVSSGSYGQLALMALRLNTAQAGGASTITLDASASATNDLYNYSTISIISGTGAGQSRQIIDYVGASKVATVDIAWATNPDNTSIFLITPLGVDAATVAAIADAVWDEARGGHTTAGTFGEYTNADAVRFSGDATAADNAEAFFDGTGYAGTNNVMPSVTTVTGNVNGSVGSVTGAVGSVTGAVGSVTGAVGSVTGNVGGNVTGSVGSLAAQAKADVNAEVVDVIRTDTVAEVSGVPAANAALSAKVGWLFALGRNKRTQTAAAQALRNDADSGDIATSAVTDDGTTATRAEWA